MPREVFLVQPDPLRAKVYADSLERRGFLTFTSTSAEAALTAIERVHPWAVVTELLLPRMSGLVLASVLKASPATRDIVVVAVTAHMNEGVRRIALEAGCADCVSSAISGDDLAASVARHLKGES